MLAPAHHPVAASCAIFYLRSPMTITGITHSVCPSTAVNGRFQCTRTSAAAGAVHGTQTKSLSGNVVAAELNARHLTACLPMINHILNDSRGVACRFPVPAVQPPSPPVPANRTAINAR